MDREAAMAAARAYLADCIELKPIAEEEVTHLGFYGFSHRHHEYHFFYYRGPWQGFMVGSSSWIAVSKKTGKVAGTGECGE